MRRLRHHRRPFSLLAALIGLLLYANPLGTGVAGEPQERTEATVFVGQIGKWQRLFLRKGSQWPVDHFDQSYYYALDLEDRTRDRDGPGVYVGSMQRLLHCYGKDFRVISDKADELVLGMHFEASQSPDQSDIRITARKQRPLDARGPVFHQLKFSGKGGVWEGFSARLKEAMEGAEFVENTDEIQWEHFPETELAPPPAPYDRKEVLASISDGYTRIENGKLIDQRVIEFDVPGDPMQGTVTIRSFETGDESVDLSVIYGDHGWADRSYYFENGELFFALDGEGSWRFAAGNNADGERATVDSLRERRYYFVLGSHPVRVLEKSASSRNADEIKGLIKQAKNEEVDPGEHAAKIAYEGYALLHMPNSTAAADYFGDGAASKIVAKGQEIAQRSAPKFDAINAQGVIVDLNADGENDVIFIGGVHAKLQALAVLGPLEPGAKISFIDLPEVATDGQMPKFDVCGMDIDIEKITGEVPEGFVRTPGASGVWIEVSPETEHLHLYWNHKRSRLGKW